jgi:PPOX class probable F420-dependent enzyme
VDIGLDEDKIRFIVEHRVARLATADSEGQPLVIPVCYAFDGRVFYSALDEKRKDLPANKLRRVRNISLNPRVALVIDDYDDDWSKLAYILVKGRASLLDPSTDEHRGAVTLLREKYSQYRTMSIDQQPVIKVVPDRVKYWRAL